MEFPDKEYRLLALFRFWNVINYFFPYKNLTGSDWNDVLPKYIPQFEADKDAVEYRFTAGKMVGRNPRFARLLSAAAAEKSASFLLSADGRSATPKIKLTFAAFWTKHRASKSAMSCWKLTASRLPNSWRKNSPSASPLRHRRR